MSTNPTDPADFDLDTIGHYIDPVAELTAAVEALRKKLIWGFYENEVPEYQQGGNPHELHELVTAEGCSHLVKNIKELRERVADCESRYKLYKHIAKSVRGALDGEHTQRDILREFDIVLARAEAAEARVVELAEHLDKTIAVAADAVNRMNANEAEIKQLRGHVAELAGAANALLLVQLVIDIEKAAKKCRSNNKDAAEILDLFRNLRTVLAALPWAVPLFARLEKPAGKRD